MHVKPPPTDEPIACQNTRYFPINVDVSGRRCIVIGGGTVAGRKSKNLVDSGADVVVIAPHAGEDIRVLAEKQLLQHLPRAYRPGDLRDAFLVFAASSDRAANAAAAEEARGAGILVDVVDAPRTGNFISPSFIRRKDLVITVSTNGKAPALTRALRKELEERYGDEYGKTVLIHEAVREKLLTENRDSGYTTQVLRALADSDLPRMLKSSSHAEIDRLLLHLIGPGYSLTELGMADKEAP